MELDDELCLCFHVTKRKVVNFLRVERPRHLSQLHDCHSAGTGCGWCRPMLKRLFEQSQQPAPSLDAEPVQDEDSLDQGSACEIESAEEYARRRAAYIKSGKGVPPRLDI